MNEQRAKQPFKITESKGSGALDDAQRELDRAIEFVRKGDNGIQYIMTAIFITRWEPPRSAAFFAEDQHVSSNEPRSSES
jgi:hypothetical protein